MTSNQRAYLAGLLDGDGSIMLQLKPREGMRYLFRVKTAVVLYQDSRYMETLKKFRTLIGAGYVYRRNDHMSELRIEGFTQVKRFLQLIQPYVQFKHNQVTLLLAALNIAQRKKYTIDEFLEICKMADAIATTNYRSSQRKYTAAYVRQILEDHNLVPVTTGSPTVSE
ncbi:MAG: LAGLIDADG family homing endonuclease [Candidatus Chisholmbacteria bacterium]|nr:LAGLIDADG family homing endonuclease [Candidatus Chisholmbacteria bacterium]MBI4058128.1 LAGLIDADG family homing endonuclease [Candidatus Gottesmanbacteria bacterium]